MNTENHLLNTIILELLHRSPEQPKTPSTAYLEEDERGEHGPQARARAGVARVEECEHADQNRRRDVGARPGVGMVRLWGRCRML